MNKNIVKATKTKKFPYRNEKALYDKNLLLSNSEILVMRAQNEAKLKIIAIFSQLSSEISLQELKSDESFVIQDMQFLPDCEQLTASNSNGDANAQAANHKNILAIIDNQNRAYLMEIIVDYEKEMISSIIFAEMPSKELEECKQICWSGEHLMILKADSLVIDRKIKLKNKVIIQKQQYLIGSKDVGCQRMISSGNNEQSKRELWGICRSGKSVFNENGSIKLGREDGDLLDIKISAYNDLIVISKSGQLYALDTNNLQIISQYNLNLQQAQKEQKEEGETNENQQEEEFIVEARMDNMLTSIFVLTSKNQIHHIFLQKVTLNNGQVEAFKSRGILRFHSKNVIFTFCVLAVPEQVEQFIFKSNQNHLAIQHSFSKFKPTLANTKYMIYTLLAQEDSMKIFSVDLTTHDAIIQESQIQSEFPIFYLPLAEQQTIPKQVESSQNTTPQSNLNRPLPQNQNEIVIPKDQPQTQQMPIQMAQQQAGRLVDQTNNQNIVQENKVEDQQQSVIQDKITSQKINSLQKQLEHKASSKPVNPSILPSPQDPIIGNQYYEYEQAQQLQQQISSQNKDNSSSIHLHTSHEQKEVKKKNQIRTLTNQNENPLPDEDDQYQDQYTYHHSQIHQDHKPASFDDIKDTKINQIFSENIERITSKLDEYFDKKFNKLDVIVSSKIEKIRKEEDIQTLVEKNSQSSKEKMEIFLKEEMENQYKNYVEQNMKTYMIEMFQQVTKNFEKGQKFYTDKIQQEKEKCKIQNENSDEILGIVKKITGPFSESTIVHKKILNDILQYSNERKIKMDQLEKQLTSLVTKQDQIVTKIQTIEKTCQGQYRPENVTVQQYPPMKKNSNPVDLSSANESGGDNTRKKQQQQQNFKKKNQFPQP